MASTVYNVEEIALQDDSVVELRPLNIATLRKFMKKMEEFGNAENEDQGFEILLDAAALCLKNKKPDFWDDEKAMHSESFEEIMDMESVYKVLEICGGVKLNDPNLIAAAREYQAGQVGEN